MLKWTASAQKLAQTTPIVSSNAITQTPKRKTRRRATISNKENLPYTSTPMAPRLRNSPLVLAPLTDILNVTPESPLAARRTPQQRRVVVPAISVEPSNGAANQRRHSTIGFSIPTVPPYASTLPHYSEEYSPSTAMPSGQQLALRGLLPDVFLGNARYLNTPEVHKLQQRGEPRVAPAMEPTAPKTQRKLELEFEPALARMAVNSTKMGDQTLDNLIDAILDSARKDEKKKKPRKSFNLRRRTLLRNQAENCNEVLLSPSYAAGDDPASDLSFLLSETPASVAGSNLKDLDFRSPTPTVRAAIIAAPTPLPATPLPGTPIPVTVLQQMPTPAPATTPARSWILPRRRSTKNDSTNTFQLETPVVRKRRHTNQSEVDQGAAANASKKFKVDARNYFEIGLALPSIYV